MFIGFKTFTPSLYPEVVQWLGEVFAMTGVEVKPEDVTSIQIVSDDLCQFGFTAKDSEGDGSIASMEPITAHCPIPNCEYVMDSDDYTHSVDNYPSKADFQRDRLAFDKVTKVDI